MSPLRLTPRQLIVVVLMAATYCTLKGLFVVYVQKETETVDQFSLDALPVSQLPVFGADRSKPSTDDSQRSARTSALPPSVAPQNHTGTGSQQQEPLYNSTGCPVDYLGMTEYAAEVCVNESSEVCDLLTCRSLLTGTENDLYYGIARKLMEARKRRSKPDAFFVNASADCAAFRDRMGYQMSPLSREEAEFPLAFNLIVHMNVEQVERQLRALYRPQNLFCIHIDRKASPVFVSAIRQIASCFDNVFIASKLEVLTWGGYNRLQADINCMTDLLNRSGAGAGTPPWRYLINTAGLAFPLKSIGEMVKALKVYNGANDVEGIYGWRVIKTRFEKEWFEDEKRGMIIDTGRKNPKPPHEIDIVRGSAYAIFSRKFVEFILQDRKALDLREWAKKTWSPDELYWATLHHTYSNPHLHTPGAFSGYPSEKPWLAVYANWYGHLCHGRMVRGVCVFGVADLPLLTQRKEFFANKFYQEYQPLALDCLEAWVRQKDACPPPFDYEYYRSLPFVKS